MAELKASDDSRKPGSQTDLLSEQQKMERELKIEVTTALLNAQLGNLKDSELLTVFNSVLGKRGLGGVNTQLMIKLEGISQRGENGMAPNKVEDDCFMNEILGVIGAKLYHPLPWHDLLIQLRGKVTGGVDQNHVPMERFASIFQDFTSDVQQHLWYLKQLIFQMGGVHMSDSALRDLPKTWCRQSRYWKIKGMQYDPGLLGNFFGSHMEDAALTALDMAYGRGFYIDEFPKVWPRLYLRQFNALSDRSWTLLFTDLYIVLATHNLLCMAICLALEYRLTKQYKFDRFKKPMFENAMAFISVASNMRTHLEQETSLKTPFHHHFPIVPHGVIGWTFAEYAAKVPKYCSILAKYPLLRTEITRVCTELNIDDLPELLNGQRRVSMDPPGDGFNSKIILPPGYEAELKHQGNLDCSAEYPDQHEKEP
ncbi:hypothetical protein F5Y16DRAFT_399086 [Xylariaceae sp. FL0255]|nr:hypothetical protein F5Y16DRAFT_399086 [Xylariaceae sp. FL0255]